MTPAEILAYASGRYFGERGLVPDLSGMTEELRAAFIRGFDDAREEKGIPR